MTIDPRQDQDDLTPMCGQAEFDDLMAEMVADETPRLFAIVHELGERADGWVAAWGLAFDDHVDVVVDGGRMRLNSPERALWVFGRRPDLTPHLIWLTSTPASGNCHASD